MSIISQGINSLHSEKNTGDSSHQALTNFSFSEFFISDFRQNKFSNFLMGNNIVKFWNYRNIFHIIIYHHVQESIARYHVSEFFPEAAFKDGIFWTSEPIIES